MPHSPLPPVLFEDDTLMAFDKPSGLLTAPDRWNKDRTCLMALIHEHLSPTIANAHRLDAETSGIVLCAKDKPALTHLARQFETHQVVKRYLAITAPTPREDHADIDCLIVDNPDRPGTMKPAPRGKQGVCVTRMNVLERWRRFALVEALPQSGKTHQIRVHLAYLGSPILADKLYGQVRGLFLSHIKKKYKPSLRREERPLLARLAHHAEQLTVTHPVTGQPVTVRSPLPADLEVALKYLRQYG